MPVNDVSVIFVVAHLQRTCNIGVSCVSVCLSLCHTLVLSEN